MLPLVLPREQVIELLADANAGRELEVDLQVIRQPSPSNLTLTLTSHRSPFTLHPSPFMHAYRYAQDAA